MAAFKAYGGLFGDLSPPEQVLAHLAAVPRLRAKLQVLLFRRQCAALVADADASLRCVQTACAQVRPAGPGPGCLMTARRL